MQKPISRLVNYMPKEKALRCHSSFTKPQETCIILEYRYHYKEANAGWYPY